MGLEKSIKQNWKTVQIPEGLIKKIKKKIKTKEVQELGIGSVSAYVVYTLRKSLDE